jgi:hypothetical protein
LNDTSIVSAPKPKAPAMPQQLDSIGSTLRPGTSFNIFVTGLNASNAF